MYNQAKKTVEDNLDIIEEFDIIQPFNYRVIKDGIIPTITTRPEGFKTAILLVDYRREN